MNGNGTRSLTPILLTVIGTLVLIISGWAGTKINDHESRIDRLESSYGRIEQILIDMKANQERIMDRFDQIEVR